MKLQRQARKPAGSREGGQFDHGKLGGSALERDGFDNPYVAAELSGAAAARARFRERAINLETSAHAVTAVSQSEDLEDIHSKMTRLQSEGIWGDARAVPVAWAAARNPHTSQYTLNMLRNHPDAGVRSAAASNEGDPAMPQSIARELLERGPGSSGGVAFPAGSLASRLQSGDVHVAPTNADDIGPGTVIHQGYVTIDSQGRETISDLGQVSALTHTVTKKDFEADSWDHDYMQSGNASGTVVLQLREDRTGTTSEMRFRRERHGMGQLLLLKKR